ncbi:RNase P subunit p30-domain-containing protein [Sporodiniella umbellata]|nr:RNase P subunit p30-domain-containing protein [Sporodiniella umbellata]
MLYDFNIPYPKNQTAKELERIEKILERIYSTYPSTVALNVTSSLGASDVKAIAPIRPERFPNMTQLTRATIEIENSKQNYQLSSSTSSNHLDILAVRPTNVEVCKHACQNLDIDIISLDLAFAKTSPNYASAQVAVSRGIFFEICYAQSFRNASKKSAFFSSVKRLVEVTRGHNLIFSSEALRALEIRKPADLRILGALFGMTQDQIEASLSINYTRLLKKAGNCDLPMSTETRKCTYHATVRSLEPALDTKRKNNEENNLPSAKKAKKEKKKQQ